MLMYDLCCGRKKASSAMRKFGWQVISIDIDPQFQPDILIDVRDFHYHDCRPHLIWASPPCDEFSREDMPWCRTGRTPDLSIYEACQRIIQEAQPRYWVIENVRGAVPYFGEPRQIIYPFFLWGFFPELYVSNFEYKPKASYSSSAAAARAAIPFPISLALARAVSSQLSLTLVTE